MWARRQRGVRDIERDTQYRGKRDGHTELLKEVNRDWETWRRRERGGRVCGHRETEVKAKAKREKDRDPET